MSDTAPALGLVLDAAEEWAETLDSTAEVLSAQGQVGREAAAKYRAESAELRAAISTFRPLRRRDPDTNDWVEEPT